MGGDIRLGLLAYSTNSGLGTLTWEFARHMKPARVLLVDISKLNRMEQHPERYEDFECVCVKGFPQPAHIARFLLGLDVIFVAETPLNYALFAEARRRGVKIIFQPMHEFNDYHQRPRLPEPDFFVLPSPWHYEDLKRENKGWLPVPSATDRFPKLRESRGEYRRFLHIAGRPAVHDRNGTMETIGAFRRATSEEASLTVRVQGGKHGYGELAGGDPRITIDAHDVPNYWEAYEGFDCLILPRKYGGLCLPMQEALASGMPVIMTNVSPNDMELPPRWLVRAEKTGEFMTRSMIDIHTADVEALAEKIRWFCHLAPAEGVVEQQMAWNLADARSWACQEHVYRDLIERVVHG